MSPLLNCPFCGGRAEIWKAQPGTTRKAWIACMTNRCAVLTREHLSDAEAVAAWNRRAPAEQSANDDGYLAQRVKELVADGDGFWRSCSGCLGLEDGQNVHGFPRSKTFGCTLGGGCRECGGIGAIWDTVDYDAMATASLAGDLPPEQSAAGHPVAVDGGTQAEVAKAAEPNTSNIKDQTHG